MLIRRLMLVITLAAPAACEVLPRLPLESGRGSVWFNVLSSRCYVSLDNVSFDGSAQLDISAWRDRPELQIDGGYRDLPGYFQLAIDGRALFVGELVYDTTTEQEEYDCGKWSNGKFFETKCTRTVSVVDQTAGRIYLSPGDVRTLGRAAGPGAQVLELRTESGIFLFAWPPEAQSFLEAPDRTCAAWRARAKATGG